MIVGIDIGGTKCAVVLADDNGKISRRVSFPTASREETLVTIEKIMESFAPFDAVGISCGGPLDEKNGIILSPPNLPGWDDVRICDRLKSKFGTPVFLRNDANACALAEWKYGAGRGTENMIFLTFGTGLGAGMILDGKLYCGAGGSAGEIGHVRLAEYGPVGYGKSGSAEGFCSGSGLAGLGKILAAERLQQGGTLPYCKDISGLDRIDAKMLAEWAYRGDETALEAYRICGEMLGNCLAVLIDILNPEAIVIGSVFVRAEKLIRPHMEKILNKEALASARSVCRILPAALGDSVGDIAAVAVALDGRENNA